MNLMLSAVVLISLAIGEAGTAILVVLLVVFNVFSGARQEQKAQASVDALATMQVPMVRVHSDGAVVTVPAPELVPGDLIELEAGDIVPADARIVRATTLETQEASLTGESTPIEKSAATLDEGGRRARRPRVDGVPKHVRHAWHVASDRGGNGHDHGDGRHRDDARQRRARALALAKGTRLADHDHRVRCMGRRGGHHRPWADSRPDFADLMLLGTAVAISAIPTGMPTFVQQMLAWGANQLAESKAIITSLNDVETLGATSAICSDKTGTLTMNEMTARSIWLGGRTYTVDGAGYSFDGEVRSADGEPVQTVANSRSRLRSRTTPR